MSDTHPNAYRLEAQEKKAEALRLNSEADALDAKAEALDPQEQLEPTASTAPPEEVSEAEAPAEPTDSKKK